MKHQLKPKDIKYWVFDMDGTLTVAVHDFAAIKRALDIPQEADILAHLAALPAQQKAEKNAWLLAHELELAKKSIAAQGAVDLVHYLQQQGYQLAILTRNDQQLAHITLEAIGLDACFKAEFILGRGEALPKPAPDGLLKLASRWQIEPKQMLIIGDFSHDLASGRNAGSHTILVNHPTNDWPALVDWHYAHCQAVLADL